MSEDLRTEITWNLKVPLFYQKNLFCPAIVGGGLGPLPPVYATASYWWSYNVSNVHRFLDITKLAVYAIAYGRWTARAHYVSDNLTAKWYEKCHLKKLAISEWPSRLFKVIAVGATCCDPDHAHLGTVSHCKFARLIRHMANSCAKFEVSSYSHSRDISQV